ncbi:MAG: iron transporter [Alphaproteobacteria bacterium]|nr:iron transporter [Alphaproteobacteria bacterium]
MVAMAANDGPHYGTNFKFDVPGKYPLHPRVLSPSYTAILRHTDKETGVKP